MHMIELHRLEMFSKPTIFLAAKSSKRVSSFCRSSRPSTFSCAEVVIFFMQSEACPVELSGLWTRDQGLAPAIPDPC